MDDITARKVVEDLLTHYQTHAPLSLVRAMRQDNWPLDYAYIPGAENRPVVVYIAAGQRPDFEARARAEGIQPMTPSRVAINLLLTTPQVHMTLDLAFVLAELSLPITIRHLPWRKAIVTIRPEDRARFEVRARELHPTDDPPANIQPTDQLCLSFPLTD